ncbi:MAG: hypothetical protein IPM39_18745 [Chloroflexi bacterium]|nr:hypothetical protein [Chloroflexota bacterium]
MKEKILGYKLLLSYEVKPEAMQEYYQFVMGRYVPILQSMGLQMSEAWHTAYGAAPNRLIGFVCEDLETMNQVLTSESWTAVNDELSRFVLDFSYKVIPYRGGFQI